MNLSLRQLRAFAEVARTLSFTEAAQNMNLTQSAVSMLVRQLETEYGMALFNRVQRRVQLTETGQRMLPVTLRILDDLQQVEDSATDLRRLRQGTLRIAVPQMLACSIVPDLVATYLAQYPDINLQVIDTSGDQVISAVAANDAEIGIGPERTIPADLSSDHLWDEPIDIVVPASSALSKKDGITWADMERTTWIHYSDDFAMYLQKSILTELPIRNPETMVVRHLSTAMAFVGKGMGVTAAPRYARGFEKQFPVSFVAVPGRPVGRAFNIYRQKNRHLTPAAAAFVPIIHDAMMPRADG